VVFPVLLVFYLAFTKVSEVVLDRLIMRGSGHGQATMGGEARARAARMSCWETFQDYALRSLGIGERLLPRGDFTLCEQVVLIGSGMIWNVYFGGAGAGVGLFPGHRAGAGQGRPNPLLRKPSEWFIFVFRGSPLFIQFFFAYFLFLSLKSVHPIFDPFTSAWLGALIVLFLNTAAYSGEIFYGALRSIPKGDVEAADAYGMTGWARFRRITGRRCCGWPGRPIPTRRSFCFTPRRWCSFRAFRPGSSAATRSITPATSPTRRSTPSCPTRSWRGISSC
jgi:ABC-type amino acid transport system permease subunit